MRQVLLSIFLSLSWLVTSAQGTVTTSPPLTPNNGQSGITFQVSSTTPIDITSLGCILNNGVSSADVWMRVGGVSPSGAPNITTAGGWTQVATGATATGANGTAVASIALSSPISIPANTPVGFHIGAGLRYQTGTSSDQVIYSDGTLTVNVSDSVSYGGAAPSPTFNPRRFLGSVTYVLGVTGGCTPFTNFAIDSISATAAKVNWTQGAGNTGFKLEYGTTGFTPGTGTTVTGTYPSATQPPVILTGLAPNTSYDVYFEEYCTGDTVKFPSAQQFTTTKLCASPTAFTDSNLTSNSVDLGWSQTGAFNASWVLYGPAGTTPGGAGWMQDTVTAPATTYTLTGLSPSTAYDIYLVTDCGAVNGISDTIGPISLTTPLQGPQGLTCTVGSAGPLFSDDFETQGGWTGDFGSGTTASNWNYRTGGTGSSGTGPNGAHSGSVYIYHEASGAPTGVNVEAISPAIDLSTSFNNAELSFWMHAYGAGIDTLMVQVGSSATGPWNTVFTNVGPIQTANADPWTNVGVNLDAYVGQTIHLRFLYVHGSGFTGDIAIDLVEVNSCQTCPNPGGPGLTFVSNDSAAFSWFGSGNAYNINWGPRGFTQGSASSNFDSTSTNSFGLGGLTGNTAYDLYIRNDCSDSANGFSGWVGPLTFVTECDPFTAPYSNNFDTDSLQEPPICWDVYLAGGTNIAFANADVEASTLAYSAPNYFRFYNYNTDTAWLFSPNFSDMTAGDKRINFFARTSTTVTTGNELVIGTVASPGDRASFVSIDTIQLTNAYQQYFVDLTTANGYNGTHNYVVINHAGVDFRTYYIDDFTYEAIPSCNPPLAISLGMGGIGVTTATATWASGSDGDETMIEWGTPGFTPGTGTYLGLDSVAGTIDQYTMTGLTAQTTYEYYIADSCAGGSYSPWVGPYSFTTQCNITFAPFLEDFDGTTWVASGNNAGNQIDPCWSSSPDVSQSSEPFKWIPRSTGPTSGNGPTSDLTGGNYMYVESSGSTAGDSAFLYTPIIDVSTLTVPALYFWQHRYYTTSAPPAAMDVEVTNDFGATWSNVYNITANTQSSSSAPWSDVFVNLANYAGDTIQIRFVQRGVGCCGDAAIDSIAVAEAPSCPDPTNLGVSSVIDTSAQLNWFTGNPASFNQVWVGPAGFYQGTTTTTGTKVFVTGDSLVVDTLSQFTCYDFLVRIACGPGDTSAWVGPFNFCTDCSPISAPYMENWDNLVAQTKDLGCFSSIESAGFATSNFIGVTVQNSTFYAPNSSPNYIELDNSSNTTDPLMLISPLTTDMTAGDKRVRLMARKPSTSTAYVSTLIVGTMSDATDASTFNALDTLTLDGTQFTEHIVEITTANGYNGTDNRFVIRHDVADNFDFLLVDDINYEQIPTCIRPDSLQVDATTISDTSATISWVSNSGTGTNFQIEYGVGPLGDPGNTRMAVTGTSINLTTLTPGSGYCVWVREICTPGDTSFWRGPECFSTLCPLNGYMAPYFTNFEGISIGTASGSPAGWENCWTHNTVSGSVRWESEDASGSNENSSSTGPWYDNTFYPASGGTYMYLETSTSGGPAELISPLINISGLSNPEIEYHYHMYGATINYLLVLAEDANGTRTVLDSIAGQQQTAGSDSFYVRNVPLTSLASGSYNFIFQGHRGTSFTGDIAIDDVSVQAGASCPAPVNLRQIGTPGLSSVDVAWAGGAGTFELEYGPAGFTLGTGTTIAGATSPQSITGLTAATAYDVYVREICAPGDTSTWTGPATAATGLCAASSKCTFNFDLNDTFGDGWNGAEITIYQNGVEVGKMGSNFTTGGLFQDSIDLCNGLNTAVVLTTAGSWASEIGIDVFDPNGVNIATYVANSGTGAGDTLAQFSANCGFPCADPTAVTVTSNVGCDSIEVDWVSNSGGSLIEYGPTGFTQGNGTLTGIVTAPYTITGLTANTGYDIYVADTCTGDTSNFIQIGATTANAPQPIASLGITDTIINGQFIVYVDATGSTNANSYAWDFGNSVTSTNAMDTVVYTGNGSYTVTLVVTNGCGSDTATFALNVNVGLEDNPLSNSLNVYPNPATDKFAVTFNEVGSADVNIRLRDAQGREVMNITERMQGGTFNRDIDVSSVARGIYMLEVSSGDFTAHRRVSIR